MSARRVCGRCGNFGFSGGCPVCGRWPRREHSAREAPTSDPEGPEPLLEAWGKIADDFIYTVGLIRAAVREEIRRERAEIDPRLERLEGDRVRPARLRDESTPEAREVWGAVDQAVAKAPEWMRERAAAIRLPADSPRPVGEGGLLPCPFCGGEPYLCEPGFKGDRYQIGCHCGTPEDADSEVGAIWRDGETFAEAAERWNRRFVPPAPTGAGGGELGPHSAADDEEAYEAARAARDVQPAPEPSEEEVEMVAEALMRQWRAGRGWWPTPGPGELGPKTGLWPSFARDLLRRLSSLRSAGSVREPVAYLQEYEAGPGRWVYFGCSRHRHAGQRVGYGKYVLRDTPLYAGPPPPADRGSVPDGLEGLRARVVELSAAAERWFASAYVPGARRALRMVRDEIDRLLAEGAGR